MVFQNVLWSSFTTVLSTRVQLCCKQCTQWQVDLCQGCAIHDKHGGTDCCLLTYKKEYWSVRIDIGGKNNALFFTGIKVRVRSLMISCATDWALRKRTSINVNEATFKINLTLKDLPEVERYLFNTIITIAFCCDVDILHVCTVVHFKYMLDKVLSTPAATYIEEILKQPFSLRTRNVFCLHYAANNHQWFWVGVWGKHRQGNHMFYRDFIIFEKLRSQNLFSAYAN